MYAKLFYAHWNKKGANYQKGNNALSAEWSILINNEQADL